MAGKWDARNERARELGYRNYYDYRAHGYGAKAPSEPAARGEDLARLRGHRGAADLERLSNRIEVMTVLPADRNAKGQWVTATVIVELDNGKTMQFTLRGKNLTRGGLDDLYQTLIGIAGGGGVIIDIYNMFGEIDTYDVDDYYADADDG